MNALQLFLHRATWQRSKEALAALRWPALTLVAMACATMALWFASEDLQNQQTLLQEETNLTHKRAEALRVSPAELAPARGLEGFQSAFPDSALREQRTLGVLVLARRYGLVVKETNLKPLAASALGLAGYEMGLPLTGSYTALRGFVDEALRADPGLALRSIQLLRKDIQTDNLQAQLVFTLWMRQGGRL
jgi:hypothetical protein